MTLFYETIALATIEPSFATEFVNNPYPLYHYHYCNCEVCIMNHRYYCGDSQCMYCSTVGYMLFTFEKGEHISYAEFMTWDEFKRDNFIFRLKDTKYTYSVEEFFVHRCIGCNIPISYKSWNKQETDKGTCDTCIIEPEVYYCANGCDSEVDSAGDICTYCQDDESDESESYDDDTLYDGFEMGQVLSEDEYQYTKDAWLSPNGDLHFVPCYNRYGVAHEETARHLGLGSTSGAERKGYIHISSYYGDIWHAVPNRPTKAQINTARLLSEAHGWELPEFAAYDEIEEITEEYTTCAPMQNLDPSWLTMKRALRDMFYRLSGD